MEQLDTQAIIQAYSNRLAEANHTIIVQASIIENLQKQLSEQKQKSMET